MNTIFKTLLSTLLFLLVLNTGRADFPKWKSFTSLSRVNTVYHQGNTLWVGTTGGLLRYNETTGEKTVFTKTNSGIPSNAVEIIKEDNDGQIWIGTYDAGIAAFDGSQWKTYQYGNSPMPGNAVLSMVVDKNNNKWVGTDSGLVKISGKDMEVVGRQTPFGGMDIWSVDIDKNNVIWLGCNFGVYAYDGNNFIDFSDSVSIYGTNAVYCDDMGNTYVGGNGGLFKWNGQNFTRLGGKDVDMLGQIRDITADQDGNLWISTDYNGIARYDGNNFEWFDGENFTTKAQPKKVYIDDNGKPWAATTNGLFEYTEQQWKQEDLINFGLPANYVQHLASDQHGNIWFNIGGMIGRYNGQDWKYYNADNMAYFNANSLRPENANAIWVAADKGLYKLENEKWTVYNNTNTSLPNGRMMDIAFDSKGNKWVGHQYGLTKFDGTTWTNITMPSSFESDDYVTKVVCDKDDHLWVGTAQGNMLYYNGESWKSYTFYDKTFAGGYVNDIRIDKNGTVWASTWGGGLNQFDGEQWKTDTRYGIIVQGMAADAQGNIWGTSMYPSTCFRYGQNPVEFNVANSPLQKENISAIDIDEKGNLWFATSYGILMYETGVSGSGIQKTTPLAAGMDLYPNPVQNTLTASFKLEKAATVNINILDMTGKQLNSQKASYGAGAVKSTVDVTNLKAGVYMLQVSSAEGVFQSRFMVTR